MVCDYFYVCPWKSAPYVCLGNTEIELQGSQEKEDTKLNWNVYTSKPKSPRKSPQVLDKNVCLVAITSISSKVGVTASKLVPRKEKMGS